MSLIEQLRARFSALFDSDRTPTTIQMEAAECGAACLSIILAHYGNFQPLAKLRQECGVSRDGCNALNLLQAAELNGLEGDGYRLRADELVDRQLPCIILWNQNHFVVLEALTQDGAKLNDPAQGRRQVTREEFERSYSEILLELKPGPDFLKQGQSDSIPRFLYERFKGYRGPVLFLLAVQVLLSFIGLSQPAFSQVFLDQILIERLVDWLPALVGLFALVAFLRFLSEWCKVVSLRYLGFHLSMRYSTEFLWHVLRLPTLFFYQRYGGEVIQRIGLNTRLASLGTSELSHAALNVLFVLLYGAMLLQYDTPIALLGIGTALLNVSLLLWVGESRRQCYARLQQQEARQTGVMLDSLANIESLKAFGAESFVHQRQTGLMTQRLNATQDIGSRDVWLLSLTQAAQQLASFALLLTGCWRILHGDLTVGMLAAFQVLLAYFLQPVQSLVNLGSQAQTAGMDLLRIKDVLDNDLDPTAHQDEGADTPKEVEGHLRLEALSFGYCPVDEPLIDGLNLDIPAHKHVAIVGATGSGKSTLANLILGLLHPWNGKILLDEVDLDHYGRSARSRLISNVSQELFVFEGTLRDNLSLWDHSVPDEQLLKALDDAQLLEDVRSMGEGLQLHLLEGGKNLSQGQVQRLEIARALLPNPRLLVMDEATSALDVATEAAVLERIAARSCTCLMITHRLKTIQNCDCIFVMDAGRIVQQGTHAELASQSGVYQKLLQSESFT